MDVSHVDDGTAKKQKSQSVFSVFSNLFNEEGRSGRNFISLVNLLSGVGFEIGSSSNLQYCLKRFVRGLGSSHLYPQCASFAALTCFIKYEISTTDEVLNILDAELRGNFSTSEQGAMHTCCALTCGAIVQSGVYSNLPHETQLKILSKLISTGKTKSYLTAATHRFIIDIICNIEENDFKEVVWPVYKKEIKSSSQGLNVYNYDFLLVCHNRFPGVVDKFILKLENSYEAFIEKIVSLLIAEHVHHSSPLYERICEELLRNKKVLLKVWTEYVKGSKESKSSFKDRTLILLFHNIMKGLKDEKLIPKLLVPRFIQILILILSFRKTRNEEDIECHLLAKSSLDLLVNCLIKPEVSNSLKFKVIEKLMFYPANMKFEKKTGTKCIQSLIMSLNSDSLKELTNIHQNIISGELKKIVDEEGNSEDWNNSEKQYALHIFVKFLNHSTVKSDIKWRLEQIKFLFNTGFIRNKKIHSSVQKCARDCFYKAIEIQLPHLEDILQLLDELAVHVNDKIAEGIVELTGNGNEAWKKVFTTLQKLKKSNDKIFVAVHLLLIHMGFQLFSDSRLAECNIEELITCYSRLKNMHKNKKMENQQDLHWSEVTVDLMLSLLSRENKLWRYVVCNLVFPQMVKYVTPSALHQIIEVLNPDSDNKILNDDQSDDSDISDNGDDDKCDKEDDEKTESSLTESDIDENVTLNDQFRSAIKDALGMSAALTDQESVDMDEMDEEEEKKLNERLSAAFKMFKPNTGRQSKKQTKEEKALTHFRFRVLDLVEIYVTNGPTITGCLDLLYPLFDLLELSIKDINHRILQHRVDVILKKLFAVKFRDSEGINQRLIVDHFEAVLSRKDVPSMIFVEMSPRICDCCTFLVRCSSLVPNSEPEIPLVSNYVALLDNFFHSRDNKLPIYLFQSVLRTSWPGNWKLTSILYELLVDPNIKLFKKMKIVDLLEIFYKNSKLHSSGDPQILSELNQIENQFIAKFIDNGADKESKKVHQNDKVYLVFYTRILGLVAVAHQSFRKHRSEMKKSPLWKNLISKMTQISIVLTNKKSRKQLKTLANLFNVEMPETTPNESRQRTVSYSSSVNEDGTEEDGNDDKDEAMPKKKRKAKVSAERFKLKKESLKLRETICNDGVGSVPFSSFDIDSLPQEVEEEDNDVKNGFARQKFSDGRKKKRKMETNGNLPSSVLT